jgi:hypothetical protein
MYFKGTVNILILLFSGIAYGRVLQAQSVYQLQYPISDSPYAGAELHILLHHELSRLDNRFIPSKVFVKENAWSKTGNILYRLIRMSTYDFYLAYIPVINQHEYFGHLARARQLNAGFTRYELYLLPPSGGRAFWGNHRYNPLTKMEQISEYAGGMEANSLMAEKIRVNSFQNGTMSFQDAMLYLGARTDFSTYVLLEENGSSDDINQYLSILNNINDKGQFIERDDLALPAILSTLADPYTIQALYSLFVHFVINGHSSFCAPSMLQIGKIGLTPFYSFELAADGPRHCLNGYINTEKHLYSFSLHKAAFNILDSYGLQITMHRFSVIRSLLSLDIDMRYWHSEPLSYHNASGEIQPAKTNGTLFGCNLYLKPSSPVDRERNFFIITGFSMKSPGYTLSYPLASGMSFNVGIGYSITS